MAVDSPLGLGGRGQRHADEDAERTQEREVLVSVEACSWGRAQNEVSALRQFGFGQWPLRCLAATTPS